MAWTDDDLGAGALGLNDQQHGDDSKLGSADPHMLAAYCFDSMRKLHYLYVVLRLQMSGGETRFDGRYGSISGPRELAGIIRDDTQAVEDAVMRENPQTRSEDWEIRARALEQIIRDQFRLIQADHDALLEYFGVPPVAKAPRPPAASEAK
jgi:hypothetical protein